MGVGTNNTTPLAIGQPSSFVYRAPKTVNVVTGGALNFSTMTLGANGTQNDFKGRRLYKLANGCSSLPWIQFVYLNWRTNGTNGIGVAEVSCPYPITVVKAYVVLRNSSLVQRGNGVACTIGGSRSGTIPVSNDPFLFDRIRPDQFGVASFADGDFLEFRWRFTLTNGQNVYRPATVWGYQGWRFNATNNIDDIDSAALMTIGSGQAQQPIAFPNLVISEAPSFTFKSVAICGDSISYNQNSIANSSDAIVGQSFPVKAAFQAGVASLNTSIGGRTARGFLNSPLTQSILKTFCNAGFIEYGANDIAFNTALGQFDSDIREIIALQKSWGFIKVGMSNMFPRTSENITNTNYLYCSTDLTKMIPYYTQATNGVGFGASEAREIWNTVNAPALLSSGTIDYLFDVASVTQDSTTTWKWKVPSYVSTLSSASGASASSVSLAAAPPALTNLVFEPGTANVDPVSTIQGGPIAFSQTGTGPFTVTVTYTNSYNGLTNQGIVVAKAHASGTTVASTNSNDGTHPATLIHDTLAASLSSLII